MLDYLQATAQFSAADEVDSLIALVADENALELATLLPQVSARVVRQQVQVEEEDDEDDLELPSVPVKKPSAAV